MAIINGSPGNDTLPGTPGDDTYLPGANDGYDRIEASGGSDTIDLTSSNSNSYYEITYGNVTGPITVDIDTQNNTGFVYKPGSETDTILGIGPAVDFNAGTGDGVQISGTTAGDTFFLNARENGWFAFHGGEGADSYDITFNGFSTVRLSFNFGFSSGPTNGVNIDLRTGDIFDDGFGNPETISISGDPGRVELQGTDHDDTLLGSDFNDRFRGRAGNDIITGFGGVDTARYTDGEISDLNVNLGLGTANYQWNGTPFTDSLSGIEEVWGSRTNDILVGDGARNRLEGRDGDDYLRGFADRDSLSGGDGNDSLIGDGGDDQLWGGFDDDTVRAGDGRDFLEGWDGNDLLDASGGATSTQGFGDFVRPGLGTDQVIGHEGLFRDANDGIGISYADLGTGSFRGVSVGGITIMVGADGTGTAVSGLSDANGLLVNDTFTFTQTFEGSAENDHIVGGNEDRFEGFAGLRGDDTIDGRGGFSAVWYDFEHFFNGSFQGINANLLTGIVTDTFGTTDTLSNIDEIAGSVLGDVINATGTTQDWRLRGQDGDDSIVGGSGNDNLSGNNGHDTLRGGAGNDSLFGDSGNDILRGADGEDVLFGGDGNDTLDASGGGAATQGSGDYVRPGLGHDQVNGHAGFFAQGAGTNLSYADLSGVGGVTVTISGGADGSGTAVSGDSDANGLLVNDTFTYVNYVQGSQDGDLITGSNEDRFEAFDGLGGNDTIDGGAGDNFVGYNWGHTYPGGDQRGIDATLATGMVIDTFGDTDTLININQLRGSVFGDNIDATGTTVSWFLSGDAGDDTIIGGDGDDTITDGFGLDSMDGGPGSDLFTRVYEGTGNTVPVIDLALGRIFAQATPGTFETLINFEHVEAQGSFDHRIVGNEAANRLETGPGNDTQIGGQGVDTLIGNGGNDVLIGEKNGLLGLEFSAQVFRLYDTAFNRDADVGGHQNWVLKLLSGGVTLRDVASGFIASAEFTNIYGNASLPTAQFVTLLYNNVLDRNPSSGELTAWVDRIDNNPDWSRERAVVAFSESLEHINKTANALASFEMTHDFTTWADEMYRVYGALLDRDPDEGGYNGWTNTLASGSRTFLEVINSFMQSQEFQNTYGSTDTVQFLTLLYQNVLNRNPGQTEIDNWTTRIDDGMTRAEVVLSFVNSTEFINNSQPGFLAFIAAHGPDDVLVPGAGNAVLSGGLWSDTFIFESDGTPSTVTVTDLEAWDALDFSDFSLTETQVIAAMNQVGTDVVFEAEGETVVFLNTNLATIVEDMITV